MDNTTTTTDHAVIKAWAMKHQGNPQAIDEPISEGDKVGLRINFPGTKDESYDIRIRIRDITWEEFFAIFEENGLAIEFNNDGSGHNPAYEYHFIKRENAENA